MRSLAVNTSAGGRLRLLAALALTAASFGLLSLLPTAAAQASPAATVTPVPAGEVEALLGKTPLGALTAGKLAETVSRLEGFEHLEAAKVQEALEKVIAELTGKGASLEELLRGEGAAKLEQKLHEVLGPVAVKLEELLGGNPRTKLEEILHSAGASELIGKLLGGSPEPQALIAQILQAIGPERLQGLVGSALTGEPFVRSTLEELAHRLATTSEALAGQFGKTVEQLPGSSLALTAPLKNGETLGVLNAARGVTLGTIKSVTETVGATGGTGGPGASGTPGATVTVTTTSATPSTKGSVAGAKAGKLRVISHKVKHANATIVLEVPGAGRLAAGGRGIHSISRETAQAERVTIHPSLTRAGSSSLRKHHRRLKVPVKVTFRQVGGPTSTVTVPLTYS